MELSTNIHSVLASKYKLPQNVIEVICNSPFKFTNKVMADPNDNHTVMLAYLFKIKLKTRLHGNKKEKLTRDCDCE
jgi:hypothetical protein